MNCLRKRDGVIPVIPLNTRVKWLCGQRRRDAESAVEESHDVGQDAPLEDAGVVAPVGHAAAVELHEAEHQPAGDVVVRGVESAVGRVAGDEAGQGRPEDGVVGGHDPLQGVPPVEPLRADHRVEVAVGNEHHGRAEVGRHRGDERVVAAVAREDVDAARLLVPDGLTAVGDPPHVVVAVDREPDGVAGAVGLHLERIGGGAVAGDGKTQPREVGILR